MAATEKLTCSRCGKKMAEINFYTYRDGSKCEMCKACLTAFIDNFDPSTFVWILEKMDVPYIPQEWNSLRDRAYAKDPLKMNGMSVIGKYLAKMKLKQWNSYYFKDSDRIQEQLYKEDDNKQKKTEQQKKQFQEQIKEKFDKGQISQAEYKTLVSTETQNEDFNATFRGDAITGVNISNINQNNPYMQALGQLKNPYQQGNFIPESDLTDLGADLTQQDKVYLAMKWGRLYTPSQWVSLQKMYICKTSLKMDDAIDSGDIETYQKLSRVYDTMMKSAKFTEAQNKEKEGDGIDSASAIVDFVELHSGQVPKYECKQPQDLVDTIIQDLKNYNKSLIYEDKSLAQQIEKYLQDRRNMEKMRADKEQAQQEGSDVVQLQDDDYVEFKESHDNMIQHDQALDQALIEEEFNKRRVNGQ